METPLRHGKELASGSIEFAKHNLTEVSDAVLKVKGKQWPDNSGDVVYHTEQISALSYHVTVVGQAQFHGEGRILEAEVKRNTSFVITLEPRGARGAHTTEPAHMPKAHQQHREWSPSRLIAWAETVGPQTAALVTAILASRPHPEQGYRSCLGILRLARRDGARRLEAACARALTVGARSYRHVDAILKHGLDRCPLPETGPASTARPVVHDQLRGPTYYQ